MNNMDTIKMPRYAKLLIRNNEKYLIYKIHFSTSQITLQESKKVFNTVSIKNTKFDYSDFSPEEIAEFEKKFTK